MVLLLCFHETWRLTLIIIYGHRQISIKMCQHMTQKATSVASNGEILLSTADNNFHKGTMTLGSTLRGGGG